MKLTTATLLSIQLPFLVSAHYNPHLARDNIPEWIPGGPNDFRGPCPMMNTLANHGYLPRDGGNITKPNAVQALSSALNFNTSLAELMFEMAIIANPEPNATFFTLDQLNRHNVLEHDASMSRTDAFFGNNHIFNQSVFDATRVYWTGSTLTADMLANGKIARQIESKAFNPNYTFTATTEQFSLGEVAAPIIVFGDMQSGTVERELVEYFFAENERLPTELGWTKKAQAVTVEQVGGVSQMIAQAASLLTDGAAATKKRWVDLHAGAGF
ncbi:Cloroperoxidase [Trematosphaeria pertusa]|uniref:Cloroperoxidase n=1 Tax=Trematosphaeria pertusa TaxID=390896 RepID=A0A6A6IVR3_9PLEO|nr:Cloroperoxidase [Trematosphaeria pertusa]KAF2254655.1 Cloroperoxidase [Trematosphaeria pertusa]